MSMITSAEELHCCMKIVSDGSQSTKRPDFFAMVKQQLVSRKAEMYSTLHDVLSVTVICTGQQEQHTARTYLLGT